MKIVVCKRYLKKLVEDQQLDNDPILAQVFNCLGNIYLHLGSYGQALQAFRDALNIQARLQFANNNALAEIFNFIGQTHLGLKQLEEAKQNLEEGVRIQLLGTEDFANSISPRCTATLVRWRMRDAIGTQQRSILNVLPIFTVEARKSRTMLW